MMKFVLYLSTIGLIFNCNLVAGQNGDAKNNKTVNPTYQSYLAHIAAANASQRLLDGNEANRWLNATPVDYRGWEYYYLKQKIQGYTASYNLNYAANDMDISNDGQTMAVAGADNHIHICNASDLTEIKQLKGHTDAVYGVDYFGKDAKLVPAHAILQFGFGILKMIFNYGKRPLKQKVFLMLQVALMENLLQLVHGIVKKAE